MELNQVEISRVTEVADNVAAVVELQDLQLALVGGGIGETVL